MSTTFSSTEGRFSDLAIRIEHRILACFKGAKNTGELGGLSALCANFHNFLGHVFYAVAKFPAPGKLVGWVRPAINFEEILEATEKYPTALFSTSISQCTVRPCQGVDQNFEACIGDRCRAPGSQY